MRLRIARWKQAFEGDENAVLPTLLTFAWNYAAFITVVKSVERVPLDEEGEKPVNSMVLGLLKSGYWATAILAVRRLVDKGPLEGARGVFSLRSILHDVKNHRVSLTRRVFVEDIAQLEYDAEAIEQRYEDFLRSQPPNTAVWVPQNLHSRPTIERHLQFDFLSGKTPAARSPDDVIQDSIFERLESRLAEVDRVADHATIFFAHAANDVSRQGREVDRWGTGEAKETLRQLVEVAELIGRWFIGSGAGFVLPIPQYDQFEHLDRPLLHDGDSTALDAQWDSFASETQAWQTLPDSAL